MPKKLEIPKFKPTVKVNAEHPKKGVQQVGILDKKSHIIKFADGTEVQSTEAKDLVIYE